MSTLSELFPSGGTQNNIEFVAQGTLANGQTVGLRSDGKVEAITGQSGSVGTKVAFNSGLAQQIAATYDSANNKVVLVYQDSSNSYYGAAIVGTVSGTAITFGSEVVFLSNTVQGPVIAFDSSSNKVVISYYYYTGAANQGQAIVGTVSGTSISFGSAVNIASGAISTYATITYDSNANKTVISYRDGANGDKGTSIVGTVSGTSISFGTPVIYNAANSVYNSSTFDSANNKVIIAYQDYGNSTYGSAVVGTVSGTSISFGTSVTFSNNVAVVGYVSTTFDSSLNKVVIAYTGASNYGYAVVGTVSGTSISFGTPVVFSSAGNAFFSSTVFDSVSNKIVISFRDDSVANSGTVITGTVSGTSISFSGQQVYNSSSSDIAAVFDVNANATVSAYYDGANSNVGTASVTKTAFTNATSFIGITNAAISSGATGEVAVKGGLSINQSSLTIGSTYYVQDNGTVSTTSSSTKAGKAISTTALNLVDPT